MSYFSALGLTFLGVLMIGACSSSPSPTAMESEHQPQVTAPPSEVFQLCYLKTGALEKTLSKEERGQAFQGHMSNMKKMAEAGDLLLAGPYAAGGPDKALRGLFFFDSESAEHAHNLAATDPGVLAGVFRFDLVGFRSHQALRQVNQWHLEGSAAEEKPMSYIQAYVIVEFTMAPGATPHALLGPGFGGLDPLWQQGTLLMAGQFEGVRKGQAFIVLDADDLEAGRKLVRDAKVSKDMVNPVFYPWYATKALTRIPSQMKKGAES